MSRFYDGYEAVLTGVSGAVLAYLRGTKQGRLLLMEFGEKAIINVAASVLSNYWPLMAGANMTDMDREYLIGAALGALTKTYKKGRLGTSLAGEQVLSQVIGHRLAKGTVGWSSSTIGGYLGTTGGQSGSATYNK